VVADRVTERTSKVVLTREEVRKTPGTGGDPLRSITSLPGIVQAGGGKAKVLPIFAAVMGWTTRFSPTICPWTMFFMRGALLATRFSIRT